MEVAGKVSTIADESQRNDLTAAAGILAGLRFDGELIRRHFRREIMMQSVIYREILQEGEQLGEQRGEKHGRLVVIQFQLERQLGTVPPELLAQLPVLSLSDLDQLGVALLDFKSADDLTRWLTQHNLSLSQ
jgi:predicted transposase YdaD